MIFMKKYYVELMKGNQKSKLFVKECRCPKDAAIKTIWGLLHKQQPKVSLKEVRENLVSISNNEIDNYKNLNHSICGVKYRKEDNSIESCKCNYYMYKGNI